MYRTGTVFRAPTGWHRTPYSCPCKTCKSCATWITLTEPTELPDFVDGRCYQSAIGSVLLPIGNNGECCVTIKSTLLMFSVFARERGGVLVDGVNYDFVTTMTTMCICWNGNQYVATGDATGRYIT